MAENENQGTLDIGGGDGGQGEITIPAEIAAQEQTLDGFKFTDEFLKENIKDGKLFGRFDSIDGFLDTFKHVEKQHANTVREMKEGQKSEAAEIEQIQSEKETILAQEAVKAELIPAILENGMELTAEVIAKAEEAGIDPIALENQAMKAERIARESFDLVGGKENYLNMIAWAKENVSESEREAFDSGLDSPFRGRLIKGLYDEFTKAGGAQRPEGSSEPRITGDSAPRGVQGFQSLREMLEYKRHTESRVATKADRELYRRRLALTPDEVMGFRG